MGLHDAGAHSLSSQMNMIDLTEEEPSERDINVSKQQDDGASRRRGMAQGHAVHSSSRHAKPIVPLPTVAGVGQKRSRSGPNRAAYLVRDEEVVIVSDGEDADVLAGAAQQQHRPPKRQQQHSSAAAAAYSAPMQQASARPDGSWSIQNPSPVPHPLPSPTPPQPTPSQQQELQQQPDPHQQSMTATLAMLAREREQRRQQQQQQTQQQQQRGPEPSGRSTQSSQDVAAAPGPSCSSRALEVSILTYNVWFKEEVALQERMRGVGAVIESCGFPDYVLLQEVTRNIVTLLSSMPWWARYSTSVPPLPQQPYFTVLCARRDTVHLGSGIAVSPYLNSKMGRGMQYARTLVHGYPLLVATTHLESPVPTVGMFREERSGQQRQAGEVLDTLGKADRCDVVLAGDLNWNTQDGPLHLLPGWLDAWPSLRPGDPGFTYDTRANPMLEGSWPGARLDRVLHRLGPSFEPLSIELVGTQALVDTKYVSRTGAQLPVLPSDHFGLLFKLRVRAGAGPPAPMPGRAAEAAAPGAAGAGPTPFSGAGRLLGSG